MMNFAKWLRGERQIEHGYDFTGIDSYIWVSRVKAILVLAFLAWWFWLFKDLT